MDVDDIVELDLPLTVEHFEKQRVPIQVGIKIHLFGDEHEADAVIVEYEMNKTKFLGAKIIEGTWTYVPCPKPD